MTYYDDIEKQKAQAEYTARANGAINPSSTLIGPRSAMASLQVSLDRATKLSSMTADLVRRIGGPINEMAEACAPEDQQPDALFGLSAAIERSLSRIEANVSRALTQL